MNERTRSSTGSPRESAWKAHLKSLVLELIGRRTFSSSSSVHSSGDSPSSGDLPSGSAVTCDACEGSGRVALGSGAVCMEATVRTEYCQACKGRGVIYPAGDAPRTLGR